MSLFPVFMPNLRELHLSPKRVVYPRGILLCDSACIQRKRDASMRQERRIHRAVPSILYISA